MTDIAKFHYMRMYSLVHNFGIRNFPSTTVYGYQNSINYLNLTYSCVIYAPGRIAVYMANNIDAISSGFSGCYMATFTHNNNRYVAHIAMDNNAATKNSWNQSVQNNVISNVTLFKPSTGVQQPQHVGIWGIITQNNRCYQLKVMESTSIQDFHRQFVAIPFGFPTLMELHPIRDGLIP